MGAVICPPRRRLSSVDVVWLIARGYLLFFSPALRTWSANWYCSIYCPSGGTPDFLLVFGYPPPLDLAIFDVASALATDVPLWPECMELLGRSALTLKVLIKNDTCVKYMVYISAVRAAEPICQAQGFDVRIVGLLFLLSFWSIACKLFICAVTGAA